MIVFTPTTTENEENVILVNLNLYQAYLIPLILVNCFLYAYFHTSALLIKFCIGTSRALLASIRV